MSASDTPQAVPRMGSPILLSFKELQEIRDRMATIDTKLDQAIALSTTVANHESRIVELEKARAVTESRVPLYGRAWDFISGLILALIAAGVWLPKLTH